MRTSPLHPALHAALFMAGLAAVACVGAVGGSYAHATVRTDVREGPTALTATTS